MGPVVNDDGAVCRLPLPAFKNTNFLTARKNSMVLPGACCQMVRNFGESGLPQQRLQPRIACVNDRIFAAEAAPAASHLSFPACQLKGCSIPGVGHSIPELQRNLFKTDALPARLHEITNIRVIHIFRMLEYILPVI